VPKLKEEEYNSILFEKNDDLSGHIQVVQLLAKLHTIKKHTSIE